MREPARDKGRLEHMLEAIVHVQEYTDGMTFEQVVGTPIVKHAVTYNIQIIGEASYWLTSEFKDSHTLTPWKLIEKTRHILVHDYYQIDNKILWLIIVEDLPPLKEQLERYIQELP